MTRDSARESGTVAVTVVAEEPHRISGRIPEALYRQWKVFLANIDGSDFHQGEHLADAVKEYMMRPRQPKNRART